MQPPPAALTIACLRCGGVVPLPNLGPRVRCPYCALDQDVPAQQLAALAQYQRSAGDVAERTEGERRQQAQWARWYGPDGTTRGGYLASGLIFGAIVAVYAAAMLLASAKIIDDRTLGRVLPGAILGVFVLGMGTVIALNVRRVRPTGAPTPRALAQCPRCGGLLAFTAGKVSERCEHCGSPLVAGAAIMHQAIDAARTDLRAATMARYRLERSSMANVGRASASNIMPYIVLGPWLLMTAAGAITFTVDFLTNAKSDTPAGGLAILWLLVLVCAGAMAIVVHLRRTRLQRWRALADATAAMLAGRVHTTASEWTGWLNTRWAGPYSLAGLLPGPCFHAVTGELAGFAVALDLDPIPISTDAGPARADILVAACLPGHAESVAVPADVMQRALALGFTPSSCSGGLVASGGEALGTLGQEPPIPAAQTVLVIAGLLVEWAARVGATPAAPIA